VTKPQLDVATRRWKSLLFGSLRGGTTGHLGRDIVAGLTLAAVTIPEQMATAKLGGFEPQIGFYAFVGATIGFAALGASRVLTAGADSTITPRAP
jgi:sulfate permease, SulP family